MGVHDFADVSWGKVIDLNSNSYRSLLWRQRHKGYREGDFSNNATSRGALKTSRSPDRDAIAVSLEVTVIVTSADSPIEVASLATSVTIRTSRADVWAAGRQVRFVAAHERFEEGRALRTAGRRCRDGVATARRRCPSSSKGQLRVTNSVSIRMQLSSNRTSSGRRVRSTSPPRRPIASPKTPTSGCRSCKSRIP